MNDKYQICSRCVSDTTVQDIHFDENGVCNYCHIHDRLDKLFPLGEVGDQKLGIIVQNIKKDGLKEKYDCIVGVSGGTDSTFCLYQARKLGLRPLAVHFDNGWNSDASVANINAAVEKLGVDIKWVKTNLKEFNDIQKSFLKASVPDAEMPTDLAIHAVLHRVAAEYSIKWIINGMNFRTEGIQPLQWSYGDGKYIKCVQKQFGTVPMATYPNLTIPDMINFALLKGCRTVPLLAYMDYSKQETKEILKQELEWTDYGGHHFESIYTRFIITDILWNKFRIDKRKIQLSAAVRSGKLTRNEALEMLRVPPKGDEQVTRIVLDRLGLSKDEFDEIFASKPKTFHDYSTSYPLIRKLRIPIKVSCRLNLVPQIFYAKYFGECI